ncbi:HAMP domain-containing histidine kinase [Clostridium botulinum]|uniref:sensor histidine kinase n=1 Tax=Clostridium botulinum TaxID=1491 RepID=UPI001A912A90|nr:HAMP domain-containing sensor histidine kinase [Clostridium botulinum]MBO0525857.1 HAMP domain-containing histidine kinase [Clostridium botulinum]MBO0528455.1 HAMP domain-containing histidine kinase [Clostridium botulinum]MBO0531904.1 HAMP domain-containing histidine kinase [Clostridium botulinum]MBO0533945.1 HAMP domain-containing histidine kinase [Clostridium botulinum]MBO0539852.1 HAMP domain-containing histidine kinase [Clostridium botulinum]
MNWLLIIIIIILSILLLNERIKTKRITAKLKNILKENSRERIKLYNLSRNKKELVREINIFLDKYESISIDNKNYKDHHQKMISNISHDIRTPLTALMGYVDLLSDNSITKEKREEYVSIIKERGTALKELMEEFFQVAKLECNDVDITIEKFNISEIVRKNVITFMNEINERNITPEINIGDEEIFALGDKNYMRRIITNLISNSLKYGYEGKVIGIDLKEDNKWIILSIWDKGKGIDKNELPYIFDRLYTGEKSRNRNLQGSGLGLSIVKNMVQHMNGSITAKSIPYEKTIFTVKIPKGNS